jgi:tRNA nucleotidyltransferase (CCA-adding enzyme)
MEIYLVGGAVRDQLLGLTPKEKDYVVVGATVADMQRLGYRQVGKDFPVFLHPETQEEYALARKERKTAPGYSGFDFDASPKVTLEEDLQRRDLTINAIAEKKDGSLIDPYHGQQDLEKKLLRHVSPAFIEDPVRILRVGRFAARFAQHGFSVAPDTVELMKAMVKSGEVDALVAERVWKELERALQEKNPEKFFEVLAACNAFAVLFPDLKAENVRALTQATLVSDDGEIRFAVLLYNLSPEQIKKLCDRYRVPSSYRDLALLLAKHYSECLQSETFDAERLLNLLIALDAFRRDKRFKKFMQACRTFKSETKFPDLSRLEMAYQAAKKVDVQAALDQKLANTQFAEFIYTSRLQMIKEKL